MRLLQPKLAAMKERIGDDKQRMSQEMMALYKAEKSTRWVVVCLY